MILGRHRQKKFWRISPWKKKHKSWNCKFAFMWACFKTFKWPPVVHIYGFFFLSCSPWTKKNWEWFFWFCPPQAKKILRVFVLFQNATSYIHSWNNCKKLPVMHISRIPKSCHLYRFLQWNSKKLSVIHISGI